jgi:TonB-linked SusC/RagA family outer membrane protein
MKKIRFDGDDRTPHLIKLLRVMKITCLLLMIALVQVSASTYSQSTKLTLNLKNVALSEVFKEIEKTSEFRFFFDSKEIDPSTQVTVRTKDSNIEKILTDVFDNSDVTYEIIDRYIVLKKSRDSNIQENVFAVQQQKGISGQVTDEMGDPLPGVTIVIKGTTKGTVTNMDGNYTIANIPDGAVLQFSFVGMLTQEIPVDDQTTINVTMLADAIGIEEVVAVGFATQKKVNLTGSVGTADMDLLLARPVNSAAKMLQGVVPGLNITQVNGGMLNENPSIDIRGVATIGAGSKGGPLILIDGMEGNINAINPQDIESISVLKDAAASSIYGSRAPFGVILVTTKKGKSGQTKVNYNNSFQWNSPMNMPDPMNSIDFAYYLNDGLVNGGSSPHFDQERVQRIKDFMDGKITTTTIPDPRNGIKWGDYNYSNDNVDWYDALYRDHAMSQEHNISASGGSEKIQFYGSANLLDQNGLMVFNQDKFNRYTTTLKMNAQLSDYVQVGLSNRFVREDFERPTQLTDDLMQIMARQNWPTNPLYDPNGYLFDAPSHALGLRDGGDDVTQTDWIYQQAQVIITPIKGWQIFGEANYRVQNQFQHSENFITYNHDVEGNPYAFDKVSSIRETGSKSNYLNVNIYTDYEYNFKSGHYLKGMVGFQMEEYKWRNVFGERQGVIVPELPALNLTSGSDFLGNIVSPLVGGNLNDWATEGFFGRINYNFKEKYLMEVNMRYDGTSRFRGDKRWNLFPSVSAAWNMANEDFWTDYRNLVSVLKVRASYGELGNQNTTSLYPTYVTIPVGTADGTWLLNGTKPNTANAPGLVSQALTWERIRSWNIGFDLRMFNNRLSSSFDYFNRFTLDMVGPAPELPVTLGTAVPKTNNTDLKTYGFEFDITWNDKLNNGFGYSAKILLSDSQTEITSYPNEAGLLSTYRTGMMIGEIWGLETIGIAKTKEEMDAHLASLPEGGQTALGTKFDAGDLMYRDLNGDKKIDKGSSTIDDPGDMKIIGNDAPRYAFGIDLSANYKGFDFRAFFQGILKRDYFQDSYYFWGIEKNKWFAAAFEEHKDYFRNDPNHPLGLNLDSYYARPLVGGTADKNTEPQTRYLQDASYIRLKNLQIGYTIPKLVSEKINVSNMRIFVSGENLWTYTKMSTIFDPETIGGGWKGSVYPLSTVYSVGVSLNF